MATLAPVLTYHTVRKAYAETAERKFESTPLRSLIRSAVLTCIIAVPCFVVTKILFRKPGVDFFKKWAWTAPAGDAINVLAPAIVGYFLRFFNGYTPSDTNKLVYLKIIPQTSNIFQKIFTQRIQATQEQREAFERRYESLNEKIGGNLIPESRYNYQSVAWNVGGLVRSFFYYRPVDRELSQSTFVKLGNSVDALLGSTYFFEAAQKRSLYTSSIDAHSRKAVFDSVRNDVFCRVEQHFRWA